MTPFAKITQVHENQKPYWSLFDQLSHKQVWGRRHSTPKLNIYKEFIPTDRPIYRDDGH